MRSHTPRPLLPRAACAALLALLSLAGARARAGLVIEADPSISAQGVRDLAIDRGNLVVKLASGRKDIRLPRGALELIAVWAASDAQGPMIISIDGAFGLNVGENRYLQYHPPCVPAQLARALFSYDDYAHQVAIGSMPAGPSRHPLVERLNASALPAGQFEELMRGDNRSAAALWYRRLACRYPSPPGALEGTRGAGLPIVAEHTLRARASNEAFPVRLEVQSWLTVLPRSWYREIVVVSPWDHTASLLPYARLQKDIEEHWPDYRQAFRPLDELSSIVEAYALLRAVHRQNEPLWLRFRDRLTQGMDEIPAPDAVGAALGPPLRGPAPWASRSRWTDLAVASVGDLETAAQAQMALALLVERPEAVSPVTRAEWRDAIEALARTTPRLRAQLLLADTLRADPGGKDSLRLAREFFTFTHRPDLFRLRVQGALRLGSHYDRVRQDVEAVDKFRQWPSLKTWVSDTRALVGDARRLLERERTAALADYRRQVRRAMAQADEDAPNLSVWEDLVQDVYSVDLLRLALQGTGRDRPDPEFVRLLAEVHYHRGMAPQVGRELAYTHAHYRFLGYLANLHPADTVLVRQIRTYRNRLALRMNMSGFEEEVR